MVFGTRLARLPVVSLLFIALTLVRPPFVCAQQASPAPGQPTTPATPNSPEFLATADEVLKDMSQITGWDLKTPLKKSLRSRAEIRAYVLSQMDDEKDAKERYAS